MPVRYLVDATNLAAARATIDSKMEQLCPGMPYDIQVLRCEPAPGGSPPRIVGPPWRFTVECVVTPTF